MTKNGNIQEWVNPALDEVREVVNSVPKGDIILLLGVSREAIYRWLTGKNRIQKSNWELLKLYCDGVIGVDCKECPNQHRKRAEDDSFCAGTPIALDLEGLQ